MLRIKGLGLESGLGILCEVTEIEQFEQSGDGDLSLDKVLHR